jgi:hypothetical protein
VRTPSRAYAALLALIGTFACASDPPPQTPADVQPSDPSQQANEPAADPPANPSDGTPAPPPPPSAAPPGGQASAERSSESGVKADVCPDGFPLDCGDYCCKGGATCENGGCVRYYCPATAPQSCGTGCCPADARCDAANKQCIRTVLVRECPPGAPVDCGDGTCCPGGTSCVAGGCRRF